MPWLEINYRRKMGRAIMREAGRLSNVDGKMMMAARVNDDG